MRRLPSGWQRNWHLVNFLASMNFVRHLHFLSPLAAQVVRGQPGQGRRGVAQRASDGLAARSARGSMRLLPFLTYLSIILFSTTYLFVYLSN